MAGMFNNENSTEINVDEKALLQQKKAFNWYWK